MCVCVRVDSGLQIIRSAGLLFWVPRRSQALAKMMTYHSTSGVWWWNGPRYLEDPGWMTQDNFCSKLQQGSKGKLTAMGPCSLALLMFQTRRASLWPGWSWYHARFCSVTPLLTQVDLPEQYRNPTTKQLFPLFCYNFNHDSPGKYGKKTILITVCESHSGLKLKP